MKKGKNDDKKKKKEQPQEVKETEFDLGFGKFSLGGILKGFGNLVELAGELAEKGEALKKEGEFHSKTASGKDIRGMYGFSVSTLAGKPVVRPFGNVRRTAKGPVVEEVREPFVDIFDEKSQLKVIAELPGVSAEGIQLELQGDLLTINANSGDRKYHKEVLLPAKGKDGGMKHTFRNGILEIIVEKAG
jgi:HSP20 family protein